MGVTTVAICDSESLFLAGHVVDSKGASAEHAIGQILRDLSKMGHYGSLRVRTDQESSITALFKAVAKERGDANTVLEHAPRSESKGNGQAEKAVQSIEEMIRTLLIDLEQRCGEDLSVTDDFFPWLVEHSCDLLNRFKVRKGNRTAWERIKGKPYTGEIYAFGTPVMHRMSGPVQGGVISERWFDGIWIGLQFTSGEHMVATSDGRVVRARAVHPRPDTVKITREALNNIRVGPWSPSEVITQELGARPAPMVEQAQPSQTEEPVPRSFRITQELLGKFDYTKGCPKCEALRRGDAHKTVHHSRECRKRIESAMNADDGLSKKLVEVEERKNKYLARQVETADREPVERVEGTQAASREADDPEPAVASFSRTTAGEGDDDHPAMEVRGALNPRVPDKSPASTEGIICPWIECSQDKRSWAELREE